MSIVSYTGLPGSGKSYGVVSNVIAPAIEQGRQVFTNIPCNADIFEERWGRSPIQFETQDLIDNPNWFTEVFEPGAVIVLDECWRLWPSGLKANNAQEQHKTFLAEHRHLVGDDGRSTEVVLVTQDNGQLAAFVRLLIEFTYHAEKLNRVGMSKRFRVDVYHGCVTGSKPPKSKRDREMYGTYKPEIYALYQSHTKSQSGDAGFEQMVDDRYKLLGGLQFKLYGAAALASLVFLFWAGNKTIRYYKTGGVEEPAQIVQPEKLDQVSVKPGDLAPNGKPYCPPMIPDGFEIDCEPLPVAEQHHVGQQVVTQSRRTPLHGFDISIIYNMGTRPDNYIFHFEITNGKTAAILTAADFDALGYSVEPISQCLVRVTFERVEQLIACESSKNGGSIVDFNWQVSDGNRG